MTRDREDAGQPDDRIPDQLARPVEGDRATAINLEKLGARRDQRLGPGAEVASFTLTSDGVDGRMLEQEQYVVGQGAGPARQRDLPLQLPGVLVADHPEPGPAEHRLRRRLAHPAWAATACSWA